MTRMIRVYRCTLPPLRKILLSFDRDCWNQREKIPTDFDQKIQQERSSSSDELNANVTNVVSFGTSTRVAVSIA